MSVLRKALGESAHEPLYIATIPRRGYRFSGQVREVTTNQQPQPRTGDVLVEPESPAVSMRVLPLAGVTVLLAMAAAGVVLWKAAPVAVPNIDSVVGPPF